MIENVDYFLFKIIYDYPCAIAQQCSLGQPVLGINWINCFLVGFLIFVLLFVFSKKFRWFFLSIWYGDVGIPG